MLHNMGAGFIYYASKFSTYSTMGANISETCGITVQDGYLCIWTATLGIPYMLPLEEIENFTQLVYFVTKLRKKEWIKATDVNYIAAFLFQRLTGQEHVLITDIDIGEESDYEEKSYPIIKEEEN